MYTKCSSGDHDLIEIYRVHNLYDEDHVVRWCKICGSVVVDLDYDGKTNPGRIMKMMGPVISKNVDGDR